MKLAMVFPGQGSQAVGMVNGYAGLPSVPETLDEARAALGDDFVKLLAEGPQLTAIVDKAASVAPAARGNWLFAQIGIAWVAIRHHYEEKVEPMLAEPVELLTHICPQLAAVV